MKIFIFIFIFLLKKFYIYLLKDNNESNYYPNPFTLSILVVVFYGVESDSTCIILQFDWSYKKKKKGKDLFWLFSSEIVFRLWHIIEAWKFLQRLSSFMGSSFLGEGINNWIQASITQKSESMKIPLTEKTSRIYSQLQWKK